MIIIIISALIVSAKLVNITFPSPRHPGIRKVMVRKMTEANDVPHFGYCDEIDMDALISLRNMIKMAAAEHGVAFSYMTLFIKVCGGWGWVRREVEIC